MKGRERMIPVEGEKEMAAAVAGAVLLIIGREVSRPWQRTIGVATYCERTIASPNTPHQATRGMCL